MTKPVPPSSAELAKAQSWSLVTLHKSGKISEIVAGNPSVVLGVDGPTLLEADIDSSVVGQMPSPCPWRQPCESSVYLIDGERPRWVESKSIRLKGGEILVSTRALPWTGKEGSGLLSLARLSLAGSLLGPMAHELNNIVQGLTSAEYLIRDSLECGEPIEMEDVDQVAMALKDLKFLGASIQGFARDGSAEREHFAIAPIVNRSVAFLRSTGKLKTADLEIDLAPELPDIYWCRSDLDFIVQALLANAVEATQNSSLESPRITLSVSFCPNTLSFRICNTEGRFDLSESVKPRLSTRPIHRHAGIGLSAVSELLAKYHGKMTQIEENGLPGLLLEFPVNTS